MSKNAKRAVVVGAGIAGLTAAIALADRSWAVEILELSPDGGTAGWGLALTGPSLRALDSLGLSQKVVDAGFGISSITNWEPNGDTIQIDPPRLLGPEHPAMAGIPRPELHRILNEEARRREVEIYYGNSVAQLHQGSDGVNLVLDDGTTRDADLVVGADGIRSRLRDLLGFEAALDFTGQAIWRALIPRPAWATGINTFSLDDRQIGVVPIRTGQAYVFMTENGVSRQIIPDEELAIRMYDYMTPFGGIAGELRESVRESNGVVRRLAQTHIIEGAWNVGQVVLVGDATHAPSPQMASGAALAIEDGVVLGEELGRHDDIERALKAFTDRRLERCVVLVKTSAQIAHLEQNNQHRESHALIDQCHGLMARPV